MTTDRREQQLARAFETLGWWAVRQQAAELHTRADALRGEVRQLRLVPTPGTAQAWLAETFPEYAPRR